MIVTKETFYNWVVDIYLKTGQGLAGFVTMKTGREPLNQLLEEGKVKVITNHYSYLPDDEWICLTGVYCVEEEMKKGGIHTRSLDFIRRYLNIKDDSAINRKVDEFFEENPNEKVKYEQYYNDWLETNKEILEKSFRIQKIEEPSEPTKTIISEELKDYAKEFGWYEDNSVSDALSIMTRRVSLGEEMVILLKRVIQLDNTEKRQNDLKKAEFELKMDKKLQQMFRETDKKLISEIFEE